MTTEIVKLTQADYRSFSKMFVSYFSDDLDEELSTQTIEQKLCPFIFKQYDDGIVKIDLIFANSAAAGFSVYQIDTPRSDWCKRPGDGCIREFFIEKAFRRKGLGRELCSSTLNELKHMGAHAAYLTADSAEKFWQQCGFCNTGKLSSNGLYYFERNI